MAALEGVSLTLAEGTFTAITGPSGCGKSTLLHLLAALDKPTSGEIEVAGVRLDTAGEKERTLYRRRTAGIVFQFFHLLPGMTLEENVSLPLILAGHGAGAATMVMTSALRSPESNSTMLPILPRSRSASAVAAASSSDLMLIVTSKRRCPATTARMLPVSRVRRSTRPERRAVRPRGRRLA